MERGWSRRLSEVLGLVFSAVLQYSLHKVLAHFLVRFNDEIVSVNLLLHESVLPALELDHPRGECVHAEAILRVTLVRADEIFGLIICEVVHSPSIHPAVSPRPHVLLLCFPNQVHPPSVVLVVAELPLVRVPLRMAPVAFAVLLHSQKGPDVLRPGGVGVFSPHQPLHPFVLDFVGRLHSEVATHRVALELDFEAPLEELKLPLRGGFFLTDEITVAPLLDSHPLVRPVLVHPRTVLPVALVLPDVVLSCLFVEDVDPLAVHLTFAPVTDVLLPAVGKGVSPPAMLPIFVVLAFVCLSFRVAPVALPLLLLPPEPTAVHRPRGKGVLLEVKVP
eukprot:Sspe_Gene.39919::Locus_19237_Transcript_1_1_Confidence_1.000_Length_1271::g.39919::m.39919